MFAPKGGINVSRILALCILGFIYPVHGALAQTYPNKPVRLVVNFPPAGGADNVARLIAPGMSKVLGQQVLVDNRAGANGQIGTDYVAKAAPDGYTLLFGSGGALTVSPNLISVPYDPIKDFTPISKAVINDGLLIVHNSFPASNTKDFLDVLRKSPGKYSFASSGAGGPTHLAGELIKGMASVDMAHIPYKGDAPALTDLMGGSVPIMVTVLATASSQVKAGKVKAIAALGATRFPQIPDLPTFAEAGFPGFSAGAWFGILAPAGASPDVIAKVNDATRRSVADPDTHEKMLAQGSTPITSTPAEFAQYIKDELAKWGKVIKTAGIKLE